MSTKRILIVMICMLLALTGCNEVQRNELKTNSQVNEVEAAIKEESTAEIEITKESSIAQIVEPAVEEISSEMREMSDVQEELEENEEARIRFIQDTNENHKADIVYNSINQNSKVAHINEYSCTHNFVKEGVWQKATCTTSGTDINKCTNCQMKKYVQVPATGHNYSEWITIKPATYSENGLRKKTCSGCGEEITESFGISAHECAYITISSTAITCTQDGVIIEECSICKRKRTKTYPTAGHSLEWTVVTAASCEEDGVEKGKCTSCTSYSETRKLTALGHDYMVETKAASCGEKGLIVYTCKKCGDSYTETIEALKHEYLVSSIVEATCIEGGYTIERCINCGNIRHTNETEAIGHDSCEWVITKEAELGVAGIKELKCSKCEKVFDSETIDMLLTDGVDSIYYITVKNDDGTRSEEIVIGHYNEEESYQMFELFNDYRKENNLPEFEFKTGNMTEYTNLRAAETSYLWDHVRPSGWGLDFSENIAYSPFDAFGNTVSVETIFNAWVASPGHKSNLDAIRTKNQTSISVFYARIPISNSSGEVVKYAYEAYWVQTFR